MRKDGGHAVRDDTPAQVIGDVIGLLVYLAVMALILDAVIPH